jgi:DNA modification methylase
MRCLIGNTSAGSVADPFAGSGASLIAADELGREWCGSEIDPVACDRIRARYRAHRGES